MDQWRNARTSMSMWYVFWACQLAVWSSWASDVHKVILGLSEVNRGFKFESSLLGIRKIREEWSLQQAVSLELFCSFRLCVTSHNTVLKTLYHQSLYHTKWKWSRLLTRLFWPHNFLGSPCGKIVWEWDYFCWQEVVIINCAKTFVHARSLYYTLQDHQQYVRPIGIGETSRRIIGKAILAVIKYILEAVGALQLCVVVVKLPSMQCIMSSKMSSLKPYYLLMLRMHSTAWIVKLPCRISTMSALHLLLS